MRGAAALALSVLLCGGLHAAPFADPTRPPGASAAQAEGAPAEEGPRLQSVLIAPNRRIAVISGQTVALGGAFGEARVVRITESEVVLQAGAERQTLKLLPAVEKRPARRSTGVRAAKEGPRR